MMKSKMSLLVTAMLFCMRIPFVSAGPGDTTVVQTFTFGSPQDAWFVFPPDSIRFEKLLMLYTLKCNPAQNPACGEWDYLTYTYLYDHTGLTDSSVVHQPLFKVNGSVVNTLPYSNAPTYSYFGDWLYFIIHDDTTSLNAYAVGSGGQTSAHPFGASQPVSRAQYLWKASELTGAGMAAGDISGMRFNPVSAGSMLNHLRIRFMSTTLDSLSPADLQLTGFAEVFHQHIQMVAGWNSLQFTTPYYWDGVSNIIVEITYDNPQPGTDHALSAADAGFDCGLVKSGADRSVTFHSGAYVNAPVNGALLDADSTITVSFWACGMPQYQPQDGTSFEGIDSSGNRVINAHVPWSNSNVYWDAGNDGGNSYDRINKAATAGETEGQWNHWAFVKNAASGAMKIYLNGVLWHSGTAKTKIMSPLYRLLIGKGNAGNSQSYEGRMDEFAVFKAEVSQQAIQEYMQKPLDALHPDYNKLVMYYQFDDGNYMTAADSAPAGNQDAVLVSVDNSLKQAADYVYGFSATNIRPDVAFEMGVFTSHPDSAFIMDSVMNVPLQVVTYTDSMNNPGAPVDTFFVYPAGYYHYQYDADGALLDSVCVVPDSTLILTYYDYFNYFPQVIRYELARYITPYGNGLSLGDGWTWTFDVTDYRLLLADSVHLTAGNWQELLDMKFLFIEGTPPRDVISIQNIYSGGYTYGDPTHPIDYYLTPRKLIVPANAHTAKWKSRITGHGMDSPGNCAEFCAKYHYFKVDGVQQFQKLVWRDNCDLNPLYPQGGTWVYDRSNWCPGAEVWTYDWEITPFITPGDTVELDHDAQAYVATSGWHYYQIEDQLVTYGPLNFTLDAALEKVLSPGTDQMWKRMNPVCTHPVVMIKNNGSTPLTSLSITYGITGATPSVFQWTGNLKFEETATVVLDTFAWMQGASTFTVSISNPNGGSDEYAHNNTIVTPFTYPQLMPSTLYIELKTNNRPYQNSYQLKDATGNIVHSRSGLTANTTYRDTLTLSDGCYEFKLIDTGEDGLSFWANTAQGNGTIRFRSATSSQTLKNFNPDFGGEVYFQFTVGLTSSIHDYVFTDKAEFNVYPNPADDFVNIDVDLPSRQSGHIEITDLYGRLIHRIPFISEIAMALEVDASGWDAGIYLFTLTTGQERLTHKLVKR